MKTSFRITAQTAVYFLVYALHAAAAGAAEAVKITPAKWDQPEAELQDNGKLLRLIFQPDYPDNPKGYNVDGNLPAYTMALVTSSAGTLVKWQVVGENSGKKPVFSFDASDREALAKLKAILEDFAVFRLKMKTADNDRDGTPVGFLVDEDTGSIKEKFKKWETDAQAYKIAYSRDYGRGHQKDMFGGYVSLAPPGVDDPLLLTGKELILEPTGLLFALGFIDKIPEMHTNAIARLEKRMAAKKTSDEKMDAQQIALAQAAQEQRIKEFERGEQDRLRKLRLDRELADILKQESERKTEIKKKYETLEMAKVMEFFGSRKGQQFLGTIIGLNVSIRRMEAEERAYLDKMTDNVRSQFKALSSGAFDAAGQQAASKNLGAAMLREKLAAAGHKDSPALVGLRNQLAGTLNSFKTELGIPFDEAREIYHKAVQTQGNTQTPK